MAQSYGKSGFRGLGSAFGVDLGLGFHGEGLGPQGPGPRGRSRAQIKGQIQGYRVRD